VLAEGGDLGQDDHDSVKSTSRKPGAAAVAAVVNKDTELDKSGCEAVTDSEKAAADCPTITNTTNKESEAKTNMKDCVVVHVHNVQD